MWHIKSVKFILNHSVYVCVMYRDVYTPGFLSYCTSTSYCKKLHWHFRVPVQKLCHAVAHAGWISSVATQQLSHLKY